MREKYLKSDLYIYYNGADNFNKDGDNFFIGFLNLDQTKMKDIVSEEIIGLTNPETQKTCAIVYNDRYYRDYRNLQFMVLSATLHTDRLFNSFQKIMSFCGNYGVSLKQNMLISKFADYLYKHENVDIDKIKKYKDAIIKSLKDNFNKLEIYLEKQNEKKKKALENSVNSDERNF